MFPLALLNRSAPSTNYKLLLYFEGADGSTTFVDSSSYNRSFATSQTPPTISTAQSQSGTSSLLLIGWPSALRTLTALIPNDGIGITTTKTWTIEGYVRLSNVTHQNAGIVSVTQGGLYPYFALYYGMFGVANTTLTGWQSQTTFDDTLLSTTSFTKVKITGDGVSINLYLDDALILSVAYPNWSAATTSSNLFFGGDTHTQGGYYDNWVIY